MDVVVSIFGEIMIELYHGDCLEIMNDIPDKSIDLILCDLPYGTTSCKWDSIIDLDTLWKCYNKVIKPNGAIVLFATQPFTTILGMSNINDLQYNWVWQKTRATGFLNAKNRPMKNLEDILVFYKKQPTYNPQGLIKIDKKQRNSSSHANRTKETATTVCAGGINQCDYIQEYTNYPRQVLEFASEGKTFHGAQKPVNLLEYLIKTYTTENETVLDNCMGSGSTGIAAINTNRNFIGIEMNNDYFELAKNRINNHRKPVSLLPLCQ